MTNQAAQTMPETVTASMCPSSDYAKGWNDCLAAMLAAAPAASGVDTSTNEAWVERAQEKIAALAAASVSERAVEMLAQEVEKDLTACAEDIRAGKLHGMAAASVRAIEQALTQQLGEVSAGDAVFAF